MDGEPAIRFIDPEVFRLCLPLWDIDNDGFLDSNEVLQIKIFKSDTFARNEKITSLDDLEKLEGYYLYGRSFSGMPNLITASTGLKMVDWSNGVPDTTSPRYNDCPRLERIRINAAIENIDTESFKNCTALEIIIWGGREASIGYNAFEGCSAIQQVSLPTSVITLYPAVFKGCTSLSNINLSGLKNISWEVFQNCTSLAIDVSMPLLENIDSQDNNFDRAFCDSGIISVSNLGKISIISIDAFARCSNLEYVILPNAVNEIRYGAFYECNSLLYVTLPVITPPTLNESAFYGTSCLIYVPDTSVAAYKSATNWTNIASRIKPMSEKL